MKTFKIIVTSVWCIFIIGLMFVGLEFIQSIACSSQHGQDVVLNTVLMVCDLGIVLLGSTLMVYPVYLTFRKQYPFDIKTAKGLNILR